MQIIINKKDRMKSGIYKITNSIDGKVYIGQTGCFAKRANLHKSQLKRNRHGNHKLQNAVNKHGIEYFVFEIIELCSPIYLDCKEKEYLTKYETNKEACYNHDFIPKEKTWEKMIHSEAVKRSWSNDTNRKKLAAMIMLTTIKK